MRPPSSETKKRRRSRDAVESYARQVISGRIVAGPLVRLACQRHLDDLETGEERGLFWDRAAALRAISFFEQFLRLPLDSADDEAPQKGKPRGKPFLLQPWQKFIVGSVFGWKVEEGSQQQGGKLWRPRRFRTAYVEIGKGNGKTPLAGGVALYCLMADGEEAAEVYAAATMRDQAKLCWTDAVGFRKRSPALRARLLESSLALTHARSGSFFKPVSSEARGLDGKRVHCAVIDELQEHPSSLVVDKMRDGIKGRKQPLIWEITNSGFDRTSVCFVHHQHSERVLKGTVKDDRWFAYVCSVDEGDEPLTNSRCWIKANPNLGVSVTKAYLRQQCSEALAMPSRESGVRRVNFCQWVSSSDPIFREADWNACQRSFDLRQLEGVRCYGGLDLSGVRDLSALALCFDLEDLKLDLRGSFEKLLAVWFWTPGDTIEERSRRDNVPYQQWVDEKLIKATPGRAIDYGFIARAIGDLGARFDIQEIAYDPYRIAFLERELDTQGVEIDLVQHGQGYYRAAESHLWMPHSVELLEKGIADRTLLVQSNACLTWNAGSAVLVADPKENRIFDKRKATGRIDGIVAAAMALGAADRQETDPVTDFLSNPVMVI